MTKNLSFKKCFAIVATLIMLLTVAFLGSGVSARAFDDNEFEQVVISESVNNTFSSLGSWSTVNDDNSEYSNGSAYITALKKDYNTKVGSFGELNEALASEDNFVIVKTSLESKYSDVKISAGFVSPSFNLEKNSFYTVTVVLNSDSFNDWGGAVIKFSGFENDEYFLNDDNKYIDTNGIWNTYTTVISTSKYADTDVTLNLLLGDTDKFAGYAAFSSVTVAKINESAFARYSSYTDGFHTINKREIDDESTVCDFESAVDISNRTQSNADVSISDEHLGVVTTNTNKVLAIETAKTVDDKGETTYVDGYASVHLKNNEFTIGKLNSVSEGFYLVSFYAKDTSLSGSATAVLHYKSVSAENYNDANVFSITSMFESQNTSNNGWTRNYFFIKGSVIGDFKAYLEFTFGSAQENASGCIYIDDITITSLTFAEYEKYSASVTACSTKCDLDVNLTDADGLNGNFYSIDSSSSEVLRPSGWTIESTDDNVNFELIDNAVAGNEFVTSDTNNKIGKIVKISSLHNTIYSIKSNAYSIAEDTENNAPVYTRVSIYASVEAGTTATVSLVEQTSTYGVITIANTQPTWYTFEIRSKEASTFNVLISLGDTSFGKSDKSSGTLYVAKVDVETSSEDAYNASNNKVSLYYNNFNDFTMYDKNSDGFIKNTNTYIAHTNYLSNYEGEIITSGVVKHGIGLVSELPLNTADYGDKSELRPMRNPFSGVSSFYALDATDSNVRLNFNKSITMTLTKSSEEDSDVVLESFFKISLSVRAVVKGEYPLVIGIKDSTTGEIYSSINVTDTRVFNEDNQLIEDQFINYTFYFKLASNEITVTPFLAIGGEKHYQTTDKAIVYVKEIASIVSYSQEYIDATESDDATVATKDFNEGTKTENGGTTTVDPTYSSDNWFVLPSILFAVLLIVAIVAFFAKKAYLKAQAQKDKQKTVVKKGRPSYSTRVDYTRIPENNEEEDEEEDDYDMYAVTEVTAPTEVEETENSDATAEQTETVEEVQSETESNDDAQ